MASNFIQPGKVMTFIAPSGGVVSGTPVLIQGTVVVPTTTVAQTLPFEGITEGVFSAPKATGATWTTGQTLYWDSTAGNFATAQSATARRAGTAAAPAASGDTTGNVKLNNIGAAVNVA
jgi:predicted RecA/RadA family phage recombinase